MKYIELVCVMGDDSMVINAAGKSYDRISSTSQIRNPDWDYALINKMARNGHWTPFAHPHLQFNIEMPIFVARQWMRTQIGMVYSEMSRRYSRNSPVVYSPNLGSYDYGYQKVVDESIECYYRMLESGIPSEKARIILPVGTYTKFLQTGSLYAFARLCKSRMDKSAQEEIREYARNLSDIIRPNFPMSWPALMGDEQ